MRISGNIGLYGLGNYKISSIHGNPYSMKAVQRIGEESGRSGKPLILAAKQSKDDLYVKDYGELEKSKSTATGGFAELLGIQEDMLASDDAAAKRQNQYSDYLNDTIGMMGLQNRLRDQLSGVGFTPFA